MYILLHKKYISIKKPVGMNKAVVILFYFFQGFNLKSKLSSQMNCSSPVPIN